jgi:hypothetical protein
MAHMNSGTPTLKVDEGFHTLMEQLYRICAPIGVIAGVIAQVIFMDIWFLGLLGFGFYMACQALANQHRLIHLLESSAQTSGTRHTVD